MSSSLSQEDKEHKVLVLIQEPKAMAKQRLMDFAASLPDSEDGGEPVTYTELIERATAYQQGGEYWNEGPRFESQQLYSEFWDDYKLVTELPVTDTYGFFSCSC